MLTFTDKGVPLSDAKTAFELLDDVVAVASWDPTCIRMGVVFHSGQDLKELVEYSRKHFVFSKVYEPDCGSVGCVGGWCLALKGKTMLLHSHNPLHSHNKLDEAAKLLGLKGAQSSRLFLNRLCNEDNQQTVEHAAAVITHIRGFQKEFETQLKATVLK